MPAILDEDPVPQMGADDFEGETARLKTQIAALELRLRDTANRTDNALQMIVSLLGLQVEGWGPEVERAMRSAIRRVHAVGHTQPILDASTLGEDTDLAGALSVLVATIAELAPTKLTVRFDSGGAPMSVPRAEAQVVLLVVSELVTNALSHGYPDGGRGRVGVTVSSDTTGRATVAVSDDGVGLAYDPTVEDGSGLSICRTLLRSIGSDLRLASAPGTTMFEFDIPRSQPG